MEADRGSSHGRGCANAYHARAAPHRTRADDGRRQEVQALRGGRAGGLLQAQQKILRGGLTGRERGGWRQPLLALAQRLGILALAQAGAIRSSSPNAVQLSVGKRY